MSRIPDGDYEVNYQCDYDNGYGIESSVDTITITVDDETAYATAYGLHFVSERDVDWEVDELDSDDCFQLIKDNYPLKAFAYKVDNRTEKNNYYQIGWIGGINAYGALEELGDKYNVSHNAIELTPIKEPWETFFNKLKQNA